MQVVKADRDKLQNTLPQSSLICQAEVHLRHRKVLPAAALNSRQVKQGELESAAARLRAKEAPSLWRATGLPEPPPSSFP